MFTNASQCVMFVVALPGGVLSAVQEWRYSLSNGEGFKRGCVRASREERGGFQRAKIKEKGLNAKFPS